MRLFIFLCGIYGVVFGQQLAWRVDLDSVLIYSSPRLIDLNQDQVQDVVIGAGAEQAAQQTGILALNGADGRILWQRAARDQVYITALNADLNQDGSPDIISGGRDAQLLALDGKTGHLLWEFWPDSLGPPRRHGWYHFYQPQWMPDINGDSTPDLLTANGGDAEALAWDPNRPVGKLLVISGADGTILAVDTMPDGRETYFSPQYREIAGVPTLIFGTGGETVAGALWSIRLDDFLNNGLSTARTLRSDTLKGFITHPSWVDLTGDGEPELVVPQFSEKLVVLDLIGDSVWLEWAFEGAECYVSPTIGQFTGDPTPDIYTIFANGQWPFYASYHEILIDGATGQIVWRDTLNLYPFTQANALDWNGDGFDELLRIRNVDTGWTQIAYQHQFELVDYQTQTTETLAFSQNGLNLFSVPALADMDQDQQLDLVYAYNPTVDRWAGNNGSRIERWTLPTYVTSLAWPGYLGGNLDGSYAPQLLTHAWEANDSPNKAFPNPFTRFLTITGFVPQSSVELYDLQGKLQHTAPAQAILDLQHLAQGTYIVRVETFKGPLQHLVIKM